MNTTYSTRIDNEQYFAHFGKAVSSAGDYNADGYVDIVVAASDFDGGSSNEGKVFMKVLHLELMQFRMLHSNLIKNHLLLENQFLLPEM